MRNVMICLLKIYQKNRIRTYPMCRFMPTCSEYAVIALQKYSLGFAVIKIVGRLFRCQPFWNRYHEVDMP